MPDLLELMEQCQRDTQEVLGDGAAGRLAYWLDYRNDRERLVKFIQDRIHSDTWENGARLHRRGKMSLERIVVECGTVVFDSKDIERAQDTLKMARFLDRSL
jgi:hypothetical protein